MKTTSFLKKGLLFLFTGLLWSCDDDFNSVGSDIVGNENLNMESASFDVVAYSRATGAVQTDGLSINSLGVLDNSVFGKSVISYVTQLQLVSGTNPTVDIVNPTVTKVELIIPYFSKLESTDSDGNRTYKLDSLYGSADNKFRLNIYESGYYLRDFDPSTNFEERQKYYSDLYNEIYSARNPNRLNNSTDVAQNDAFFFDKSEHILYEDETVAEPVIKERLAPQMKIELDKAFFQNKIFEAPAGQMDNNNTFANYFRGMFFQIEDLGSGSQMAQLNFAQGKITIHYTTPAEDEDAEDKKGTVVLNLTGNNVSLIQNQFSSNYENALTASNETTGDEKLYIKGSEGSVAYVDLFNGTDELEQLRTQVENENWLINEANLVFYIDKSQMDNLANVPQRIYLFDAEKNIPLVDYSIDTSTYALFRKFDKYIHGGIMEKDSDGKGVRYKFRITKHISNLLKNADTKNVKIGVCLTENIAQIGMTALKDGIGQPDTSPYRYVPVSSVMSPLGTVLYGNNTSDDKKLKLEIIYTKP